MSNAVYKTVLTIQAYLSIQQTLYMKMFFLSVKISVCSGLLGVYLYVERDLTARSQKHSIPVIGSLGRDCEKLNCEQPLCPGNNELQTTGKKKYRFFGWKPLMQHKSK